MSVLLTIAAASIVATVFAIAVAGKARATGFAGFERAVGRLWFGPGVLTARTRRLVAVVVLSAEGMAAAGLAGMVLVLLLGSPADSAWRATGILARASFVVAAVMLGAFAVAQAVAVRRRLSAPCACFGRTAATTGPVGVVRSAVLFAVCVAGATIERPGPAGTVACLVAVLAGCVTALLLVNLEDLVSLFRTSPTPIVATRPDADR
jgi:alkylhydroperoxidase/carboxymuconolactone decarboxylase family protein YurZ